jgi:hypothetical protein
MRTLMRVGALVAMFTAAACGEEAPSCQQAVSHYYGAGCRLVDVNGRPFTEAEVIGDCKGLLAVAPDSCVDDLEDLRFCFAGVPSPIGPVTDCDCTREQDALLTCE